MSEEGPTYAECKKSLKLGSEIILPNGDKGVFLKARKAMCEVIRGDLATGPKACVSLEAVIEKTFGVHKKTK